MPYEVVDPAERDERGTIHRTLTEAMVAASPTAEVWELADDYEQTRMVMCWPDPEFQPAAAATVAETTRFVKDHIGRAEREASTILAEHSPVNADQWHALVSLAWGRGFIAGFGAGTDTFANSLNRLWEATKR